ncbi:MAG: hypothetical protein RLZZ352_2418 [Pseudomonadota bacterium]|jgi:CRISPR-associated protein Cmr6
MSNYPFYQDSIEAAQQIAPGQTKTANTGLWFTRFYSAFEPDWSVGDEGKRGWIDKTVGLGASGSADQIESLLDRQRKLCLALGGQVVCLQTQGNFVTGTGLSHPVENGFTFHPTLGMPYWPASGVKGLLRAWVEVWMDHGTQDKQALVARWFGTAKGGDADAKNTAAEDIECAGSYIFFDALPGKPVHLGCDVMTPHMGKWYEQGGDYTAADQATAAPADWHSPVPVPFLVVKQGTDFTFMVAPRLSGNPQTDAQTVAELPQVIAALKNALEWLGAGAKTAAGYGRMVDQTARALEQQTESLKQSGIKTGEDVMDATLTSWNTGARKLCFTLRVDGQPKAQETSGADAQKLFDALPEAIRKKLSKGKVVDAKVRVERKGNQFGLKEILS